MTPATLCLLSCNCRPGNGPGVVWAAAASRNAPLNRVELLAHNRDFIIMATELLHVLRGTEDRSCSVCGAEAGVQHRAGFVCHSLVKWRRASQYGSYTDAA